jgi:hypothetical protein
MGVPQSVYIGPYAEWLVRPDEPGPELEAVASGALLEDWGLSRTWGLSHPPEVEVEGVVCQRYCFVPDDGRPGQPTRRLYQTEAGAVEDLRGIDSQAEIEWFAQAFRNELRALEKYYNRPPVLGWGVVTWFP